MRCALHPGLAGAVASDPYADDGRGAPAAAARPAHTPSADHSSRIAPLPMRDGGRRLPVLLSRLDFPLHDDQPLVIGGDQIRPIRPTNAPRLRPSHHTPTRDLLQQIDWSEQ